jgi:hypothetical protein
MEMACANPPQAVRGRTPHGARALLRAEYETSNARTALKAADTRAAFAEELQLEE